MLRERPFGSSADAAPPGYIGLQDLEEAGIKLAERRLGARDLVYAPGDPDGRLYFLLEGTVRLYKIYGGHKEATVALLKDGGVFGELGLDAGTPHTAFAETLTAARVAVVRKPVLVDAVKRHPEFAMKLFFSFAERLKQSDEAIESLLSREVSARLATLLLHLGDRLGHTTESGTVLKVRLTHQELANMVVSTREAVSKVMSEFQREGLIEIRNRRICLTPRLSRLAAGPPSLPTRAAS